MAYYGNARRGDRRNGFFGGTPTIWEFFNRPLTDFSGGAQQQGEDFRVDIRDTGTAYEVTADLPGCEKGDIELSYEDGVLEIGARHHAQGEAQAEGYLVRERVEGTYRRAFRIEDIDGEAITAAFADGTLRVTAPKRGAQARKTIEIR
ncbi:MAG: Hsp20/alpha crystallin family protein [Succinivibrionaceae bacterium]|nr:Hsp20/alpha crystallin family protein [Succinivibrionaceae bacterium]